MNITDKFAINPATMDMYDSPISALKMFAEDWIHQAKKESEDTFITQLSFQLGYEIDKEELIKALAYDRKQYEKGFHDAEEHFRAVATWEYNENADEDSEFRYKCGRCGCPERSNNHRFCSSCGARMKPKEY